MRKFTVYFRGKFTVDAKDIEEAHEKAQKEVLANPLNFDFYIYFENRVSLIIWDANKQISWRWRIADFILN